MRSFQWGSNDSALGKVNNYCGLFQEIKSKQTFDGTFLPVTDSESVTRDAITKEQAISKVMEKYPEFRSEDVEARLVWQPGGPTLSPFYPYWKVTVEDRKYHVLTK